MSLVDAVVRIYRWYHALAKPRWTPPDPAFSAIWTLIFLLAAVAFLLAWRGSRRPADRAWLIGLFALNGVLNMGWTLLFFVLRRPDWALVETAGLWLSIVALIALAWSLSRTAGLLLAPYLLWVSVAGLLNYEVVRLNGPFS